MGYLVEIMSSNDQEDLTAPLLVIASVCKASFKVDNLCTYTYEVYTIIIVDGVSSCNSACDIKCIEFCFIIITSHSIAL